MKSNRLKITVIASTFSAAALASGLYAAGWIDYTAHHNMNLVGQGEAGKATQHASKQTFDR